MNSTRNILLIGGTGDAVHINQALHGGDNIHLVTSLAGRTSMPSNLEGEVISGGFSRIGGLDRFLLEQKIELVIDASHPFAEEISRIALQNCEKLGIRYLRFDRKPWTKVPGDIWIAASDTEDAVHKLLNFQRIFLSIGRQELSAFTKVSGKKFVVRSIEDIEFSPDHSEVVHITARGPFSKEREIALLKEYQIEAIVSKNSGGEATYAKIAAARSLSLPVVMIQRPSYYPSDRVDNLDDLLKKIRLSS